ncbi:MAG: GNAT family N-acetyltransferase [Anaerolineae bacterium]|nr:GNAT family N-acetyltransferase [Anaerolineae bacterium]
MSVTIERVENKKQLQEFIKVPWTVYENDPNWVPWLYFERLEFFDKNKNHFFAHAEADYFIARRNGKAIGSIAAILNHRHNEFHGENIAHFGVFELLNDAEAAAALLRTACDWAKERGADKIIGPMNLSTNDECGMLLEGYDTPPVILIPYNPPYYHEFMAANGFSKAMDLFSWDVPLEPLVKGTAMPEKVVRVVNSLRERSNLTLRPLNMKDLDNEIQRLKTVYNGAWEKNWGFVPLTDDELDHLVKGLKPIIDPDIILIAEKEGEPVGFSLAAPDVNVPLHKIRPGASLISSYIGGARMILNRKKTHRFRVLALGVLEAYRSAGVGALFYLETVTRAFHKGYTVADGSWVLETNDPMNKAIAMLGGKIYKKHRLYEKTI